MMNDFGFRARLQMLMMDKELKNKEIDISALKEHVEVYKGKCKALEEALEVANKLKDEYKSKALVKHECKCKKKYLDKETFVNCIEAVRKGYKRRNEFSDALESASEGWVICNIGDEWLDVAFTLLCKTMHDDPEDSIIEWWMFEDKDRVIATIENGVGKQIDVTKPEFLYDYLISR